MQNETVIRAISQADIHSITSGQVIVDIVSVIKEVLENSLDADCKNIEIIIYNYSLDGIDVKDDGNGIKETDFENICLKNYTSKLSHFNDLNKMKSLGFRGEALNSLCFISDLLIYTCTDDESGLGYELVYDHNGVLVKKEHISHSKGTTIKVRKIFKNLPVRHKIFTKNYKKQYNKVIKLIQDYCIINYQVNLKVWNINESGTKKLIMSNHGQKEDGKEDVALLNLKKLLKNAGNIFGGQSKLKGVGNLYFDFEMPERKSFIKENNFEGGRVICEGLISKTAFGFGRSQRADNQFIYVNKRPIDYPKLQNLVNEEYRKFNNLQYPFFIINLKMPTTMLDLNITPNKRTIFVHDELKLFELFREELLSFWDTDGMSLYRNKDNQPISKKRKIEEVLSEIKNSDSMESSPKLGVTHVYGENKDNAAEEAENQKVPSERTLEVGREATGKVATEEPEADSSCTSIFDLKTNNKLRITTPSTSNADQFANEYQENKDPVLAVIKDNQHNCSSDAELQSSMIDASGSKALHEINVQNMNKYKSFQSRISSFMNPAPDKYSHYSKKRQPKANDAKSHSGSETAEEEEELVIEVDGKKHTETIPSPKKHTVDNKATTSLSQFSSSSSNKCENTIENVKLKSKLQTFLKESFSESDKEQTIKLSQLNKKLEFNITDIDAKRAMNSLHKTCDRSGLKKRTLYSTNDKIENTDVQEELLTLTVSKQDFLNMQIVGQFNLGFILCTRKLNTGYDMFIIDQHASDEKFNFEQLARNSIIKSQTLIRPIPLELNIIDKLVVTDNKKVFFQNGFKIKQDKEKEETLYLTSLPLSEKTQFTLDDFYELIGLIKQAESSYKDVTTVKCSKVRTLFAMRACRMSIMIGKPLNDKAMKKVVNNLSSLNKPWNCPHGRPTIRHLMELKSYNSFDSDYSL